MTEESEGQVELDNDLIAELTTEGFAGSEVVAALYSLLDTKNAVSKDAVIAVLRRREARGAGLNIDEEDEGLCVVCLEAPKDTLLLPCKHLCLCHMCAPLPACPLCRTDVTQTIDHIYL